MKKKLISEVSRIQELMGKSIISEQLLPKVLKNIFTDFSDDVLRKIFKTFDSDIDNAVNVIKRGDTVSDDIIEKLIKNLDFENISKIIFDNKILGTQFDSKIDEAILFLKNNPKKYDSVIEKFNDTIDKLTNLRGAPPELIQSLKNELKNIIDDGVRTSGRAVDDVVPEVVTAAERYAGSRIADFGAGVFRLLPLVSRNLKTVVTILSEQRKGIQILKEEINSLFDDVLTDKESLRNIKTTLEDKLATIERISDGGAERVLSEIESAYKQLLLNDKISKVDYERFLKEKNAISSTDFWNQFIAPNYKELDKQVSGLGSFFRNGKKAFSPLKLDWTSRTGKFGWVPKVTLNKDGVRRMFNFLAFNSAQTGADVLKRLIKSNPPGKSGANQWISETYLRAIGPQLIVPFANAAFWTVWIPATEWFQQGAEELGLDVNWDVYEDTFSSLLADLWFDNLLDIWNKDPESTETQIELGDFRPIFKSRLLAIIKSFSENDDYKEPNDAENTTPTTSTTEGTVPDDLKTLMGNRLEEIKVKSDNTLFWGMEEYVVEKRNGEWKVYFPPSPELGEPGGWYLVSDMEL
jgi:hypothetical protein